MSKPDSNRMDVNDVLRAAAAVAMGSGSWPDDRAVLTRGRKELAEQFGLTVSTIHGWREVPAVHAPRIAAWLGVPLAFIRPDMVNEKGDPDAR